ncbi:MAG: recombinase family protein [Euryarchaeota archaeon]|nr:recombinase family protein [Euryarchaeota archaeon]
MTILNRIRNGERHLTFEDLKGLRAEGYIRDSTLDQRDGFGPDIQRRNIQRFAESYGLALGDRWYTEFVSGRSASKRREFRQFVADAKVDRYDVLLVDHTSRFGRKQAECIRYKEELQRVGKTVVFVSQGIISGSDRDFLAERINETLDEQYSRNLSRYVRAGFEQKFDAGRAIGGPPLGYKTGKSPSGRGAWLVPNPRTMPALLVLLRGYASGTHSFRTLAQELNAQGYQTSDGKPFTESSISTILNNRFYEGKVVYHRGKPDEKVREGVHEVPEEVKQLWLRCQEVRRARRAPGQVSPRSRRHAVYPLTGVLACDECGEPFHGMTIGSHGYRYQRMAHSWRRCGMRPRSFSAPRVEGEFAERVLAGIRLDAGWRTAVLKALAAEGPQPDHTLERRRIEAALANLRKQHLWGALTDEEFKAQFQALERQRRLLEAPPPQALTPNLDRTAALLQELPALWHHPGVTAEQRRELAREVFAEVRLRDRRLVAVRPRPAYAPLFAYALWRGPVVGGARSP